MRAGALVGAACTGRHTCTHTQEHTQSIHTHRESTHTTTHTHTHTQSTHTHTHTHTHRARTHTHTLTEHTYTHTHTPHLPAVPLCGPCRLPPALPAAAPGGGPPAQGRARNPPPHLLHLLHTRSLAQQQPRTSHAADQAAQLPRPARPPAADSRAIRCCWHSCAMLSPWGPLGFSTNGTGRPRHRASQLRLTACSLVLDQRTPSHRPAPGG